MTYKEGEKISGLKPYVFYSCRYRNTNKPEIPKMDIIINYSLDNYISIKGWIEEPSGEKKAVNDAGYLISGLVELPNGMGYRGIEIDKNGERLVQYAGREEEQRIYNKKNGLKYYYDSTEDVWYTTPNGIKLKYKNDDNQFAENDNSGYKYYKEAFEFRKRLEKMGITNLTSEFAIDENGNSLKEVFETGKILDFSENIEEPNSSFNVHRKEVIKYAIEKNLSNAISNFNSYSDANANFQMPELTADDWDKINNDISIITFLQGLNIGGKSYNGYSIINNTKNKEVVTEHSIYITTDDGYYHSILEKDLGTKINGNSKARLETDFDAREYYENNKFEGYFFPETEIGSYESVINQTNIYDLEKNGVNIYQYLLEPEKDDSEKENKLLAKLYFTALGRERKSQYRPNL